jgi:hypothetical protein
MAHSADTFKFIWYALKINFKNSMELKASFYASIVGMIINDIFLITIWMLFASSIGSLNGWTTLDMLAL